MLYQIRWKKLLTVLLTSGLASTVNVKIPENLQHFNLSAIEAQANSQTPNRNSETSSSQLQAKASGRDKPVQTRSNRKNSNIGRNKPIQTRSNLKDSELERDKPIRTRSAQPLSNRAFRENRAPTSPNKTSHYDEIPVPQIRFPAVKPPNPHQTEFAPPPLPKAPKLKKPSYRLPQPSRDRNPQRPETVILPEGVQRSIDSQDPFYSLDAADRELVAPPNNPLMSGATLFFQVLAVSSLAVPIWYGVSKLKRAKLPSSSDS